MGKTLDDAPAGAYEAVKQRALAVKNATDEYVTALYGSREQAESYLRALAVPDLKREVCELMMAGLSMVQCAELAGIGKGTISRWFSSETADMQKLMRTALTRDALLEIPKTWATLKSTRDSENEETRRKGALDCMRASGLAIDPGQGSGISIHANNLQFNNLSVGDLDLKIMELAQRLGPEAVQLAEAEVKGVKPSKAAPAQGSGAPEPGVQPTGEGGASRVP